MALYDGVKLLVAVTDRVTLVERVVDVVTDRVVVTERESERVNDGVREYVGVSERDGVGDAELVINVTPPHA